MMAKGGKRKYSELAAVWLLVVAGLIAAWMLSMVVW